MTDNVLLFDAIMREDLPTLKKLVDKRNGGWLLGGYQYDLKGEYNGKTLLEAALEKGEEFADVIWNGGFRRDTLSRPFWREEDKPLERAIIAQNVPMVRYLLENRIFKRVGPYRNNPGKEKEIFDLVMHKDNYNRKIVGFFVAARPWGHYGVTKAVIEKGDAIMLKRLTFFGYRLPEYVDMMDVVDKSDDIVNCLLDEGCRIHRGQTMNLYAKVKSVAIAERLYRMGLGVNEGTQHTWSPLWETQHPAIFEFLLKHKATRKQTKNGFNIWIHALSSPEMTQAAINGGLGLEEGIHSCADWKTPLMEADNVAVCRVLFAAGANVNACSDTGQTIVMRTRGMDKLKFLVEEAKADLTLTDEDRNNALHLAVMENDVTRVAYLAQHGCPTYQVNLSLETPIDLARRLYRTNPHYRESVRALEQYETGGCLVASRGLCPFMKSARPHMRA